MSDTLSEVPRGKLVELPVFEDCQLGLSTGMALAGMLPVSIYPRWNFLLLATNQLVLHLDKLPDYSNGGYRPKVIIRTAIPSEAPLHPQAQHVGDFTAAFRLMCRNVKFVVLEKPSDIVRQYEIALNIEGFSTVLVERIDSYGMEEA